MATPDNKDLLAAFSPYSEYFAISSGDGRVKVLWDLCYVMTVAGVFLLYHWILARKFAFCLPPLRPNSICSSSSPLFFEAYWTNHIWDTLKGQLQTEFANITSPDATGGIQQRLNERGHLSLDYKCMQWVQLGKFQKKKKSGNLLLVLGTGGGDILALDVAAGILKWKVSDCHPGGASSVSFSRHGSLYTGGVDGMVCKIDPSTGNLLGKFRASTKAISALSVSAVTALDRANAEDAMLPIPKLYDSHNKKRKHINNQPHEVLDHVMVEPASNVKNETLREAYEEKVEEDNVSLCLEDRLKTVGILCYGDNINLDKFKIPTNFPIDTSLLTEPHILGGMNLPAKKVCCLLGPSNVFMCFEVKGNGCMVVFDNCNVQGKIIHGIWMGLKFLGLFGRLLSWERVPDIYGSEQLEKERLHKKTGKGHCQQ
ncbi:hypothetical protein Taro_004427 [Colocasia esculenta]|uniref:Uncharacterized protein n=1 Tax=Colocasia esculenta TaxID=4460 RepID=A0A843TRK8_COLES|nr:hypothetical protein [Colocasia esculenta]